MKKKIVDLKEKKTKINANKLNKKKIFQNALRRRRRKSN